MCGESSAITCAARAHDDGSSGGDGAKAHAPRTVINLSSLTSEPSRATSERATCSVRTTFLFIFFSCMDSFRPISIVWVKLSMKLMLPAMPMTAPAMPSDHTQMSRSSVSLIALPVEGPTLVSGLPSPTKLPTT